MPNPRRQLYRAEMEPTGKPSRNRTAALGPGLGWRAWLGAARSVFLDLNDSNLGLISAGIDMSLYLVSELADRALARRTALQMEYRWLEASD